MVPVARRCTAAAVLVVVLSLGAGACGSRHVRLAVPPARPEALVAALPPGADGVVDRVVDRDTLVVGGRRVRLIGVDTPETVKPGTPVQCYGPEASAVTKALLPAGTRVRLVPDVERTDRYGRDLAYVYRSRDRLFVDAYLVQEGFARTLSIAPNVAQRSRLGSLAEQARSGRRGLWSACR